MAISMLDLRGMPNEDLMNVGTVDVNWFPQLYWIFVGSAIAVFTLASSANYILFRERLYAAQARSPWPAKPKNLLSTTHAIVTAVSREIAYASWPSFRYKKINILVPTIGTCFLISAYLGLILGLCFYELGSSKLYHFQNLAYRAAFVSLGQLSLIFLLAGKHSMLNPLIGSSYERIKWAHRWAGRILLITVTLHMGCWFREWALHDYIGHQMTTDATTQKGFAAWTILLWINFSSWLPIRNLCYEFFALQHVASYIALITMVFLHTPKSDHVWLWAVVAIYFWDRLLRFFRFFYINLRIFHRRPNDLPSNTLWSCQAELVPLADGATKIIVQDPPISWRPGQHILLSWRLSLPFRSHPFTISTLPSDEKIELLVKSHRGSTSKLLQDAKTCLELPVAEKQKLHLNRDVLIGGPYGRTRPLQQFDSLVLFAGGIGATFTVPILRDIVRRWSNSMATSFTKRRLLSRFQAPDIAVTRHVRFIWAVKSSSRLSWFSTQLSDVCEEVKRLRSSGKDVKIDMNIFVTCDETFASDWCDATSKPVTDVVSPKQAIAKFSSVSDMSSSSTSDKIETKARGVTSRESVAVKEIDGRLETDHFNSKTKPWTYLPDGNCCCQTSVRDDDRAAQDAAEESACHCCCNSYEYRPFNNKIVDTGLPTEGPVPHSRATERILHEDIGVFSGRPHPRSIIRTTLEKAKGESAVVTCGPRAMNEECRRATVALSDERAVMKGSGALGVYYWGEGFGYS